MSIKYQCPICDEVYKEEYEAEDCLKECVFETYCFRYDVIKIDTTEDIKGNIEEFAGKCGTCRNCNSDGRTFADCPRSGVRAPDDGCDAYVPDTITFGPQLETLWNEQKEAGMISHDYGDDDLYRQRSRSNEVNSALAIIGNGDLEQGKRLVVALAARLPQHNARKFSVLLHDLFSICLSQRCRQYA